MKTIKDLVRRCKAEINIHINPHKNSYMSVEEYIKDREDWFEDVPKNTIKECIKRDIIIDLQFYPNTPIGFYNLLHWDMDEAIKEAH